MPLWLREKLHLPRELRKGCRRYRGASSSPSTTSRTRPARSSRRPSRRRRSSRSTASASGPPPARRRPRQPHRADARDPLPALARACSTRRSPTSLRLQGQQRRVQADGPGALRRAEVRRPHPRAPDRPADDGSFRLDMSYFNYCQGLTMTSRAVRPALRRPPRKPESPITQREMDLAASIQAVTEEIMLRMARHAHADRHEEPLPGRRRGAQLRRPTAAMLREGPFETSGSSRPRATPAARSARRCSSGTSCWTSRASRKRRRQPARARCSARRSPTRRSARSSTRAGAPTTRTTTRSCATRRRADRRGEGGRLVPGRMEFGPRALGAAASSGDARSARRCSR
jgi:carbamoyltransferase